MLKTYCVGLSRKYSAQWCITVLCLYCEKRTISLHLQWRLRLIHEVKYKNLSVFLSTQTPMLYRLLSEERLKVSILGYYSGSTCLSRINVTMKKDDHNRIFTNYYKENLSRLHSQKAQQLLLSVMSRSHVPLSTTSFG